MTEATFLSETSAPTGETTQCENPNDYIWTISAAKIWKLGPAEDISGPNEKINLGALPTTEVTVQIQECKDLHT